MPPPPPWGVLKNGRNPTYREYNNKTLKNVHPDPSKKSVRELKFEELKSKIKEENTTTTTRHQTIQRTVRRKYLLGKSKNKKTVGVLIKDKGTRKQILQAQKELKGEPINDVKKYLRNHNLIKIGTLAPNDVVRKLYESSMFAGDVTNNNEETMLHNFMKDNDEHPSF
jgi:glutamate 5-kinase